MDELNQTYRRRMQIGTVIDALDPGGTSVILLKGRKVTVSVEADDDRIRGHEASAVIIDELTEDKGPV